MKPGGNNSLTLDSTTHDPPVDDGEVCDIVSECLDFQASSLTDAKAVSDDVYSTSS